MMREASAMGFVAPSLPKGGGAIAGMDAHIAVNSVTGTGTAGIALATSAGRSGLAPSLLLSYDSTAGNSVFGFGWQLGLGAITRSTRRKLPLYRDEADSDVFELTGADELVPLRGPDGRRMDDAARVPGWVISPYRPRIEGGFARIERWREAATGSTHWRVWSADNQLTIYGMDAESRIADPADPNRVFSWLISETRDVTGNVLLYRYKAEDGAGIDLANPQEQARGPRNAPARGTNRHIKRILYGNMAPLLDGTGKRPLFLSAAQRAAARWHFEVVFDYGEHDLENPGPRDDERRDAGGVLVSPWPVRPDPFGACKPGFELRTLRRCRRVLMFHHFPDEAGVGADCLVKSTQLLFKPVDPAAAAPVFSFLEGAQQWGHVRAANGGYASKPLPPSHFDYAPLKLGTAIESVDPAALQGLPSGLDPRRHRWIDLHGDGTPGILFEGARGGWHYKRNLSPLATLDAPDGRARVDFAPVETVALPPVALAGATALLMDVDGAGRSDLLVDTPSGVGIFAHDEEESWRAFQAFADQPSIPLDHPDVRYADLDGDGQSDMVLNTGEMLLWYPSRGRQGYGEAVRLPLPPDDTPGASLVFSDATRSLYFADMNGDGLADIVRIRNGSVSYWPNLGNGRFGEKLTMDAAPFFDTPDQFDPERLRLADIDGNGLTDIIYLHPNGARIAFNRSGDAWSAVRDLGIAPQVDRLETVITIDLLGNGTVCLVWPPAGAPPGSLSFVNLAGDQKPHLMTGYRNNLGAQTRLRYRPSTAYCLADRRAGTPWMSRLPFPIHVVEEVERIDHIAATRFVSRYRYHHGHFDGEEREFRGFAMVEQIDAESFEDHVAGVVALGGAQDQTPELHQAPVTVRSWYHTGQYVGGSAVLHRMRADYYAGDPALALPEPQLAPGLTATELKECARALKGVLLRSETYSFDGSEVEQRPYTISEACYEVAQLQPRGDSVHGVTQVLVTQSLGARFERDPSDPVIAHQIVLARDELGNPLSGGEVRYGRRTIDPTLPPEVVAAQRAVRVIYSETEYTDDLAPAAEPETYRLRVPCEARAYDVTGIAPAGRLFTPDELRADIAATTAIAYDEEADGSPQRRLLSHGKTRYLDDDMQPLAAGKIGRLGLTHRSYRLAFASGRVAATYGGAIGDADMVAAGYIHLDGDAHWWVPSGTAIYPADPAAHFFMAIGVRDPFGVEQRIERDAYDLLTVRSFCPQAPWQVSRVTNDYRVLAPVAQEDANGNRTAIRLDALGMVEAAAILGKAGAGEGDTLDDPTNRFEYDLFAWHDHGRPAVARSFARERHGAANPGWHVRHSYSDGSGNVVLVKTQAPPGKALVPPADGGPATEVDADPRWIGNGRTIVNNKGKPVKSYQPYYSATSDYEDEASVRRLGVTGLVFYDPLGRAVRILNPNGTFVRSTFSPWWQASWDANDTVTESRWWQDRGAPDPDSDPEPPDPEARAAWLAAAHADTPEVSHFDNLGRPVLAVTDRGDGQRMLVRSDLDLTGSRSAIVDPLGRRVASGTIGMGGEQISTNSAEKGRSWVFTDVIGRLVRSWDEHGTTSRQTYDAIHRVTGVLVGDAAGERMTSCIVYGDLLPDAATRNLLGAAYLMFDGAGCVRVPSLDFKGNPTVIERRLLADRHAASDWQSIADAAGIAAIETAANALLEAETFHASATFDALGRPLETVLPDGTVMRPTYDVANGLASLEAQFGGVGAFVMLLAEQDHDAKGQRLFARYGNDVIRRYFYDPDSFRLVNVLTAPDGAGPGAALQDLHYVHDPVGNIVSIRDDAQQTRYFANAVVTPERQFVYDAANQLIRATGRELAAGNGSIIGGGDAQLVANMPHANNLAAVRRYTETYQYDLAGNLKQLSHSFAPLGGNSGWVRRLRYAHDADPTDARNLLLASQAPGDPDTGPFTSTYVHEQGNMVQMPGVDALEWNALDQLVRADLGGGGTAFYSYDGGARARKLIERPGDLDLEWIYLGLVVLFRRRRRSTGAVLFERWTTRFSDDVGPFAQIDTKTIDSENFDPDNPLGVPLLRYQLDDHLGSASIELDGDGNVISYEEYHPFGTTAYRAARSTAAMSLKRYRFSGKERDEETGLYYFGARYYAPWLGRWASPDPAGLGAGLNLYRYCSNNPVKLRDPLGMQDEDRQFGLPAYANVPEGASQRDIDSRASRLRNYVVGLGYQWSRDGLSNPAPIYQNGSWQFGQFDPDHIPSADPLGITREPPPSAAPESDSGDSGGGGGSGDGGAPAQPNISSGATMHDSVMRGRYEAIDRANSAAAQETIEAARVRGDPDAAMDAARTVSADRNAGRTATQRRLTPPGRVISERLEGPRDFDHMVETYRNRLPSAEANRLPRSVAEAAGPAADEFEVARRIAVASGESRWYMRRLGQLGRVTGPLGVLASGYALEEDIRHGDWGMAAGDALTVAGNGIEVYALFGGTAEAAATVSIGGATVGAVTLGLAVGGVGLMVTSGISMKRAIEQDDTAGAIAGGVGVAAGAAITVGATASILAGAGVIAATSALAVAAPVLIGVGLVAAVGVGVFHLGRHFDWW